MFEIQKQQNDKTVLRVKGEVDVLTADAFVEPVKMLLGEGVKQVTLDLTELEYIDSTGIGQLIDIRKNYLKEGQSILLKNPKKNIMKLFTLTGVDRIFRIVR